MATVNEEIKYKVGADVSQAVAGFQQLAGAQDVLNQKTQRLMPNTQQSNMLLMNTGRIVQDLPFGIMGIGNNITFLSEQFATAKAQGIGFKDSLKGMASALLGTGGVIMGINILITVMTMLSRNTKTGESYTKDFIETMIKGSSESEEYAKAIGQVTKALQGLTDETLKSRIKELTAEANSLWVGLTRIFNPSGFGNTLLALKQVLTEQEQRDLKKQMGLGGNEQGLIERLQGQIKINTELRDGAMTLSEQANYQSIINSLQAELNKQLNTTKSNLKDIKETMIEITGGRASSFNRNESAFANPDLRLSLGGDATRELRGGGGASMAKFSKEYAANLKLITDLTVTAADTLRSEFSSAWQDIFGEANSLFEKLLMNIASKLAERGIESLFGSLLNFIVPGLGTVAGMATGSQQININLSDQRLATVYVKGKNEATRLRMN